MGFLDNPTTRIAPYATSAFSSYTQLTCHCPLNAQYDLEAVKDYVSEIRSLAKSGGSARFANAVPCGGKFDITSLTGDAVDTKHTPT